MGVTKKANGDKSILVEVLREAKRQDVTWGPVDGGGVAEFVGEMVGEVTAPLYHLDDPGANRRSMIRTAATAIRFVRAIDRREQEK